MNITKVKYEKLFPTGAYANEKIGFEAEIGTTVVLQGEDADKLFQETGMRPVRIESALDVIEQLRQLAEFSHKEKYPHLYTENGKPITIEQVPQEEIIPDKNKALIDTINYCTTEKFLQNLRPQVERANDETVIAAFENKLNQLK